MNTLSRIRRIASNTRQWTEKLQKNKPMTFSSNLRQMCGIASYELFTRLKRAKLNPTLCYSYRGHAFILCHEYIVDVTATQFGPNNPIEIVHKDIAISRNMGSYWCIDKTATTREEVEDFFCGWPNYQKHPKLKLY
jgi:hypothetical protein